MQYKYLSLEQRQHFLQYGWIKIPKAVREEHLKAFTDNVWVRLGYDPEDKTTWTKEKVRHRCISMSQLMILLSPTVDPYASASRGPNEGFYA